jgi:hypothetical protein
VERDTTARSRPSVGSPAPVERTAAAAISAHLPLASVGSTAVVAVAGHHALLGNTVRQGPRQAYHVPAVSTALAEPAHPLTVPVGRTAPQAPLRQLRAQLGRTALLK